MCEICSKLTITTPERYRQHRSSAFLNFEKLSYIGVSIVEFEQLNTAGVKFNVKFNSVKQT